MCICVSFALVDLNSTFWILCKLSTEVYQSLLSLYVKESYIICLTNSLLIDLPTNKKNSLRTTPPRLTSMRNKKSMLLLRVMFFCVDGYHSLTVEIQNNGIGPHVLLFVCVVVWVSPLVVTRDSRTATRARTRARVAIPTRTRARVTRARARVRVDSRAPSYSLKLLALARESRHD